MKTEALTELRQLAALSVRMRRAMTAYTLAKGSAHKFHGSSLGSNTPPYLTRHTPYPLTAILTFNQGEHDATNR